jgi:hypothetical protein
VIKPSKSKKTIKEESSSSDEEWTHIPLSNLRDYMSAEPSKKPQVHALPSDAEGVYVEVPTDTMEIIADPKEPEIRTWVENFTFRLYIFWMLLIAVASLLSGKNINISNTFGCCKNRIRP